MRKRYSPPEYAVRRQNMINAEHTALRSFLRYLKIHELTQHLKAPSQQVQRWVKAGHVNQLVLEQGSNEDLRALIKYGASFEKNESWSVHKGKDISNYTTEAWKARIELLFQGGWKGGKPFDVILETAAHHPKILDLWKKHAPDFWRKRGTYLQNKFNFGANTQPKEVVAMIKLGATMDAQNVVLQVHPRLSYLQKEYGVSAWIEETTLDQHLEMFQAIDQALYDDKHRRRVRGELPFQDFPWIRFHQAALQKGKCQTALYLQTHFPIDWDRTWEHLLLSDKDPAWLWIELKTLNYPLPTPTRKHAQKMIEDAMRLKKWDLVVELLQQGYQARFEPKVEAELREQVTPEVWAAWQKQQMQDDTVEISPPKQAVSTSSPLRRRL